MAFVNFSLLFGVGAAGGSDRLASGDAPAAEAFGLSGDPVSETASRNQSAAIAAEALVAVAAALSGHRVGAATLARPSVHSLQLGNWILAGVLGSLLLIAGLLTVLALVQRRGRLVGGGLLLATLLLAGSTTWIVRATLADDEEVPIGNQQAPVAAVLVFDTSPRMQYQWRIRRVSRKRGILAYWLIRQLPPDSEVAVVDSRPGGAVFAVDLSAALRSIERLETTGVPVPLTSTVNQAIELAAASRKARREVYVFSDLTEAAWTAGSPVALQRRWPNRTTCSAVRRWTWAATTRRTRRWASCGCRTKSCRRAAN
jgi:hypothetical protein